MSRRPGLLLELLGETRSLGPARPGLLDAEEGAVNGSRGTVRLGTTIAMLALTAACGGGGGSTTAPAPIAVPSAALNQINPVPRDRVQDGGTFTWPLSQLPSNFNYNELDGSLQDNAYVMMALLPKAFVSDAVATPNWSRDFLASEPLLTTEPKQVVTYALHPKAIWYDGTPITWQDFYWQWKANNGTDKAYHISSANGYEDIENVQRGKDDREVVVTFKHRYADWQGVFSPLFPVSTNKDPKVFNDGWRERPLTTAGPFKLDKIDQTAKTITLVRNERWWGNPAKLDRIVFRVIDYPAWIDALANGEIDAMDIGPDANMSAEPRPCRTSRSAPPAVPTSATSPLTARVPICRMSACARRWRWPSIARLLPGRCSVRSAESPRFSTTTSS